MFERISVIERVPAFRVPVALAVRQSPAICGLRVATEQVNCLCIHFSALLFKSELLRMRDVSFHRECHHNACEIFPLAFST